MTIEPSDIPPSPIREPSLKAAYGFAGPRTKAIAERIASTAFTNAWTWPAPVGELQTTVT